MKLQATLPQARRIRSLFVWVSLAGAAIVLGGCASAPERTGPVRKNDYGYMTRTLDWRIDREMKAASVPGVVVAVVDDRRVVWSKGYGVAQTGGAAVSTDTCFRIGSVSKLFTATEIVRLASRGELALDNPVSDQLPGFGVKSAFAHSQPITPRALLSHHAGLPQNHLRGMWEAQPGSLAGLQSLLRDEPLVAVPQTRYAYSNLGYALLGRLIEHQSGLPFGAAMRRDLLEPLGMEHAAFERNAWTPEACAKGHRRGQAVAPTGLRDESAGAMVASANDMARFLEFVLADGSTGGRSLLPPEALRAMFEPQFPNLPLDFGHRIGLGWMLSGLAVAGASGPIAWHAGQYPGFHAAVVVSRDDKLAAVVLANGEEAHGFALQTAAKAIELALEAQTGWPAPEKSKAKPPLAEVKAADLAPHAGDYTVFGSLTHIEPKAGRLGIDLFGSKLDLVPTADGRFALQKGVLGLVDIALPDLFVRFTRIDGRRYAVLEGLPAPMAFERLEKTPLPPAWLKRLGRYVADGGDDTLEFLEFELAADDGVLTARVVTNHRVSGHEQAAGRVVLRPLTDDLAEVPPGAAMDGGLLQAHRRNGQDVLTYSGYVLTRSSRPSGYSEHSSQP